MYKTKTLLDLLVIADVRFKIPKKFSKQAIDKELRKLHYNN